MKYNLLDFMYKKNPMIWVVVVVVVRRVNAYGFVRLIEGVYRQHRWHCVWV